jgi:limonene-1,2-epoxide hydrolase
MSQGMDAVRRICQSWNELTVEDWREICTPDVKYQNMPWDRVITEGPDAIHETLSNFSGSYDVRMEVTHVAGNDEVVFSERTEHFTPNDRGSEAAAKEPFSLPVTGVFELREGKVSAWRDYFDRRAMKS